jgi:hypothetical protein
MSTICKLDPNVRARRALRRDVRRNLAATFDYLMATGKIAEALNVGRVLRRIRLLTDHAQFMRVLTEETSPGPAIISGGTDAVASAR